jgi:hypothetical protein
MKRIYNQPTVTTVNLLGGSVMQAASPAPGISAGTGGGTTGSMGSGDPIGGD